MNLSNKIFGTTACAVILTTSMGCNQKATSLRSDTLASAPHTDAPLSTKASETEAIEASTILKRMAEFLAKTPSFTVELTDNYDVTQTSGQKIEFGEKRKITVSRPNKLRIEMEESRGEQHIVLYDGKDITVFNSAQNVYAQTSKVGGIDVAITYFLKDLHMRLPLAVLLLSRFPDEIEQRTIALDYVEKTTIYGIPSHHLAGQTATVDYQVWIAEGAQPLPQRIVLTYKHAEGQPQFRAQFSEWNLQPEINPSQFAFAPPQGAQKIAFAAQIPSIVPDDATKPAKTGAK